MTVPKDTTYPAILTRADWQKKKNASSPNEPRGIVSLAQSKIDTGIGAALAEAETAWKAIKWEKLNANKYPHDGPESYLAIEKANRAAARAYLDTDVLQTAHDKLTAAKTKADAAAKAKLLTNTANVAAKAVSTKLQELLTKLASVSLADFDKIVRGFEVAYAGQEEVYTSAGAKVTAALKALSANPTKKGWDKAELAERGSEVYTIVIKAIKIGRDDFKPYGPIWHEINALTTNMKLTGVTATDKKAIEVYLKAVSTKLKTVLPQ